MLNRAEARKIILAMPGVDERLWFNMPSVFVHDRFLAKVHHMEDAVVMQVGSMEMREMMLEAEPKLFYITDHYRKFPFVLMRLGTLNRKTLKEILTGRMAQLAAMKPIKRKPKPPRKGRTVTTREMLDARERAAKKTAKKKPVTKTTKTVKRARR